MCLMPLRTAGSGHWFSLLLFFADSFSKLELFLLIHLLSPVPGSMEWENPLQMKLLFFSLALNPLIGMAPLDPAE